VATPGCVQAADSDDAHLRIDHRHRIQWIPHLARARRVVGALHLLTDEGVDLLVRVDIRTRLDLPAAIGLEGLLREDLAGKPQAGAHLNPVVRMAHVVELDAGVLPRAAARTATGLPRQLLRHGRRGVVTVAGGQPQAAQVVRLPRSQFG
jgi:hypothetical protein